MAVESLDIIAARAADAASEAVAGNEKYFGFLTEGEAAVAIDVAKKAGVGFVLSGGHAEAERVMIGFLPDWCEPDDACFPIDTLTIKFRKCDIITHRDVLGSLMALGIERDTVGDILCEEGRVVVFLYAGISGYVIEQLSKIGRVGIAIEKGAEQPLPIMHKTVEVKDTVASSRLDSVVSALARCGRSKAVSLIESGYVSIDGVQILKITHKVNSGNRISIRSVGTFKVDEIDGQTKKGRLILIARKYV